MSPFKELGIPTCSGSGQHGTLKTIYKNQAGIDMLIISCAKCGHELHRDTTSLLVPEHPEGETIDMIKNFWKSWFRK